MSRCFPFPPPGYSSATKEIVSELIKLQEEKQLKKEKRRQKKEKRERRERRKNKKGKTCPNSDKSDIVKGLIGQQVCSDKKDKFSKMRIEAKCEKLEQSSLTEEHGYPNNLPGPGPGPTSSCESTENTSNRKKRASPEDDSNGRREPILLRLPSKRQEVCNTEGIINIRNNGKETYLTSGQIGDGKTNRPMSDCAVNSMQGVELRYKDLLENWLPPRLQDTSLYTQDSDWLFRSREKQDEKRQRCGTGGNASCCRSSESWARAEYLPEVGAFALPFVIPY